MTALNEQIAGQTWVIATKGNMADTEKKITVLLKTVEVLESKVDYLEYKSR